MVITTSCSGSGSSNALGKKGPTQVGYVVIEPSSAPIIQDLPGRVSAYQVSDVRPQVSGLIDEQLRAAHANVAAAAETLRLENARYRAGIDPYLSMLIAQRSLYSAEQNLIAVEYAEGLNAVALYEALGADTLIAQAPAG